MLAGTRVRLSHRRGTSGRGCYLGMDLEIFLRRFAGAALFLRMGRTILRAQCMTPSKGTSILLPRLVLPPQNRGRSAAPISCATTRVTGPGGGTAADGFLGRAITDHGTRIGRTRGECGRIVGVREGCRMVGIELPILAMRTPIPHHRRQKGIGRFWCAVRNRTVSTSRKSIHIRQERGGMLMGTHERAGVPWSLGEYPLGLRAGSAAPNDLERIALQPGSRVCAFSCARRHCPSEGGQRTLHIPSGWPR